MNTTYAPDKTAVYVHVTAIRRERNSVNGNPRYTFVTTSGAFTTMVDASCVYKVSPWGEGLNYILNLNPRGQIVDLAEV